MPLLALATPINVDLGQITGQQPRFINISIEVAPEAQDNGKTKLFL